MNLLQVERYKNYHRIEYYLSFLVILIPLILALSMRYTDTPYKMDYAMPGQISLFSLLVSAFGMASSMGIFHIFFAVIGANTMAVEVESRYYMMYFPKIASKKSVVTTKQRVLTEGLLLVILVFLAVGLIALKLIILDTDRLSTQMFDSYSFFFGANLIAMIAELVAFVQVSIVLGLFLRPLATILTSVGIFFVQLVGASIPVIKYIMPKYYLQVLMEYPDWTNQSEIIMLTLLTLGVCATYSIAASLIGRKKMAAEYE